MVNGRQKGARGELEVAAMCERWWGQVEPGCKFRRTPGSGGWGGSSDADVRKHFKVGGDLMTTAHRWPFTVEVKFREGWSLEFFLFGSGGPTAKINSPVWGWWQQCCVAATNEGREPLMFFRSRGMPWLAMARCRGGSRCGSPAHLGCEVRLWGPGAPQWGVHVFHAERLLECHPAEMAHEIYEGEKLHPPSKSRRRVVSTPSDV